MNIDNLPEFSAYGTSLQISDLQVLTVLFNQFFKINFSFSSSEDLSLYLSICPSISPTCFVTTENSDRRIYIQVILIWEMKRETQVRTLGWEDPLEEAMATHSSILSWRMPWTEDPGGLQSMGSQRVGYNGSDLAWEQASGSWQPWPLWRPL